MNKLKEKVKSVSSSENGSIYITACCVMVFILMLASVIWTYTGIMTNIRTCADGTDAAVRAFYATQTVEMTNTIQVQRKGISYYFPMGWEEKNLDFVKKQLNLQSCDVPNRYYIYDKKGNEKCHLDDLRTSVTQIDKYRCTVTVEYKISVPLVFMGETVTYCSANIRRNLDLAKYDNGAVGH